MKRKTLNIIVSLVFLVAVAVTYYFMWSNANTGTETTSVTVTASFSPVDVSQIKTQAEKLIQARQNNAGIPIPAPSNLGKSDPFSNPE